MKPNFHIFATISAASLLIASGCAHKEEAPASKSPSAPVNVTVMTVTPVDTTETITMSGQVESEFKADLATRVMGRVSSVLVREGDSVRKGQLLATLESADLNAGISQAQANLNAAQAGYHNAVTAASMEQKMSDARIAVAKSRIQQAQSGIESAKARLQLVQSGPRKQERAQAGLAVEQAKAAYELAASNLRRNKSLLDDGAISKQIFDQTQMQYDVANAQLRSAQQAQSMSDEGSRQEDISTAHEGLRQAEAELVTAKQGLTQALASAGQVKVRQQEVKVAQSGIMQMNAAKQMATVNRSYAEIRAPFNGIVTARLIDNGSLANPGAPLLKIEGGKMRFLATVPESNLKAVKTGQQLPVFIQALGMSISGKVSEIPAVANPATHTAVVKLDIPAKRAKSGMFGRAELPVGSAMRLLVPQSAVWSRDGLSYLYTVEGEDSKKLSLRIVTVGEPVGDMLPVLSGVERGANVVVEGRSAGVDGQPANISVQRSQR